MSESFTEMLEESLQQTEMRSGEVVLGKIVQVGNENAVVSVGLKSEAEIPLWQFKDMSGKVDIKEGEEYEVEIEAVDDGSGRTRLSREKACRARTWEQIETAFAEQTIITGMLTNRVKGGFSVSIQNIRGFLPGSLYGVRLPPEDEEFELETEPVEFKIIKIDRARNNVVVSRRAVLEKELSEEREALLTTLEEGQVVEGVVKNLTDYGAFVNLGGLDGLLHITDLAWRRVKHPSDVLTVGEKISVKVLKCDRERSRISLGLKQLTEDPWLNVHRRYKVGDRIFGNVASLADYGAFIEIEEGVKGLVHISEMDWTSRNVYPTQVCAAGEEVEVMILSLDVERHRISLGMKQCKPNPWIEFSQNHERGERITGEIKSLTDFGIFVSLENGIDGLVHTNDISWSKDGEEAIWNYHKGDEIEVSILTIDAERERISLGIKQIQEDPFLGYVTENGRGTIVEGSVVEIDDKGVKVALSDNISGTIRNAELSKTAPKEAKASFQVGNEVKAKILSIDRKNRKISLSIKALEQYEEGQAIQEYATEDGTPARTLGEKLKEKLFTN